MKKHPVIAFIGCGNLATSLVKGLIESGYPTANIWASNRSPEKNQDLRDSLNINTSEDNREAAKHADVVVLGVKPQQMHDVVKELSTVLLARKPLIISVAIGVSIAMLCRWIGGDIAIVRSMPNTAALVGAGASGLFANSQVEEPQKQFAESLHRAVGMAIWVSEESLIDVVASLSGSGPAYFFYMMEAMEKAAISLGMGEKEASELALQTALGASRLAIESPDDVITLRRKVTSPKGTTEQAIKVFEQNNVAAIIAEAMRATIIRSQELTTSLDLASKESL